MAGYVETFTSVDGDKINANLFEQEYTAINDAFDAAGGHNHNGVAGDGGYIPLLSDLSNLNEVSVDSVGNRILLSTKVGVTKTLQLTIDDGVITPAVTNDIDIGTVSLKIKDIHSAGQGNFSTLALGIGSTVTSILDEDDFISNSISALVTQQSAKAYIDGLFLSHAHDGSISPYLVGIADATGFNAVDVDTANDKIVISTDVASAKVAQVNIDATAIYPQVTGAIDLGTVAEKFGGAHIGTLTIAATTAITSILDEVGLTSNSATALATQQSIKQYIDTEVDTPTQPAPATTLGQAGDKAGMVAKGGGFFYICFLDFVASTALTGSIDPTASTAVVGVGTLFNTELAADDWILVSGETRKVASVTDNLNLTVTAAFTDTANDATPEKTSGNIWRRVAVSAW